METQRTDSDLTSVNHPTSTVRFETASVHLLSLSASLSHGLLSSYTYANWKHSVALVSPCNLSTWDVT